MSKEEVKKACVNTTLAVAAGWKFDGSLVEGKTKPCGEWDTGEMWECPFFVQLPCSAGAQQYLFFPMT